MTAANQKPHPTTATTNWALGNVGSLLVLT